MPYDVDLGESWDAAYAAASLGQTLTVAPGDHGTQVLTTKAGKTSAGVGPKVTFNGAGQARVGLRLGAGADDNRAPSHLAFKGVTGSPGSELFISGGNANDILIEGFSAKSFYINGAQNLTIKGGVFDPRPEMAPQTPNSKIDRGSPALNDNIVIDGATIRNYTFGPDCIGYGGSYDCHGEGLIIFGGKGVMIRNCTFADNWIYHIFCQWDSGQFPQFSLTVEDCDFGAVKDGKGATRGTSLTLGSNRIANILAQRNYFSPGQYFVDENAGQLTNVRAVENTFASAAAYTPGISYDRNVWTSGAKGTDTNGSVPPPPPPPPPPPTGLTLRKVSETATKITLGWDPVPGAVGYRFSSAATAPKWSHTFDPTRKTVVFSRGQEPYRVEALGVLDGDVYP